MFVDLIMVVENSTAVAAATKLVFSSINGHGDVSTEVWMLNSDWSSGLT